MLHKYKLNIRGKKMARLFGTDGVRGIANIELDSILAYNLGRYGAYVLTEETHHKPRIAVGKDTRVSGDMLEAALVAGICSMGAEAVVLGVIPTPAVAYLTRNLNLDAGIMISASHNPFEYNGIKFFDGQGFKLSDELEDKIERLIKENGLKYPIGAEIGHRTDDRQSQREYIDFLKTTMSIDLSGIKVVCDCANGAAYETGPAVLRELGAEVHVIHDKPNGININVNCGSTHPEGLAKKVKELGAHVGLAFDGDADRLIAVDENGEIVHGDFMLAIFAKYLKSKNSLKKDTIVGTVMSNMGLDIAMRKEGVNLIHAKVGDRYVLEEMQKGGYVVGGEQSGHIIFLEHNTTGDGILTALQLLTVIKDTGESLSKLASIVTELPQVLINAKVANEKKNKYMDNKDVADAIFAIEKKMDGNGRVLIRPSGTEPLVRVMLEGENQDEINLYARDLADLIQNRLGV